MKNTKKLLTAICAAVVLFATVFAIASAAVVAGENTSITEYANMKISASHGFENGKTMLFDNNGMPNDGKIPENARVYTQNNGIRAAVAPIYGDEQSVRYFVIDYDTNPKNKHWYIQPKLGVLDNPEKTPANGFVAEFDIAFLTPVEIIQEQAKDEYGDLVWETEEVTDVDGNTVLVPKQAVDEAGNLLWEKNEDGSDKLDENGNPIPQKIPVMQNAQEPLYTDELKLDENGKQVYKTYDYGEAMDENGNEMSEPDGYGGFISIPVRLYEQATDANGNLLWEKVASFELHSVPRYLEKKANNSNESYFQLVDVNDNLLFVQATDANGNLLWEKNEDGTGKVDENGSAIPVLNPITNPDEAVGKSVWIPKKLPEYVEMLDENGEIIMTDKVVAKEWKGLTNSFEIAMYNTHTYLNGSIGLLNFETDKDKTNAMKLASIKNNQIAQPAVSIGVDEWLHIAVQYDAKTLLTYVYLGRDDSEFDTNDDGAADVYGRLLVGVIKAEAVLETTGETVNVYPLQFRMGSVSSSGVVGIDNLIGYQGTTIHDPTLLNNKLPYEKYLYLADALANETEYETVKDAEGNVVYRVLKDENGDPVYKQAVDAEGNLLWEKNDDGTDKIDAVTGEKIPVLLPEYVLDTLGRRVPEYVLDANGNKKVVRRGVSAVDRYQSFNLLATDQELRKVYTKESFGGDPTVEELEALELAFKLYDAYALDKKDNTGSTASLVSCYYEMLNEARLENAATYLSYALDAKNMERTLDNHEDRLAKIIKAKEFYDSVGSLIERDNNGDYGKAVKLLDQLEIIVKNDEAASNFVKAMTVFKNSITYGATASRVKNHYDNATYYYDIFKNDHDYNSPDTTLVSDSVTILTEAVDYYVASEKIVNGNVKEANSVRFAGIVSMMQKKSCGVWSQDGEAVEALWLRALDIILDDNYDASLESFRVAKIMFDSANKYFWDKMQNDHLKVISDKLDSYNGSDMTYIDKAGVCTFVERYIQANERYLDLDSIEITREISRNEAYKQQLNTLIGDYKKLLVENAPRFMSVVRMSKYYSTYAELKPMYDEATKYYYSMNIEGEGIEECLEAYEELRELITSIERDSQAYIDVIYGNVTDENGDAIYKPMSEITDKKELYASLKEAYLCYANLDITYPGAAEAKAIYDDKYQEYNDSAAVVNTELASTETVVYATRGNWSFGTVVAFVKKLINTKG